MQLVEHRTYGKGKILKKRFSGFELYVEFEDEITRWVRRDEVRFLSETPILSKHGLLEPVLTKEQFKARQIIEALRLGVVPHKYVEKFTFGRGEEIKQIKSWLDNQNDGVLAMLGEYGVGKTHLLEYIYSFALNNNWAVSIIELDPNEAPFHKPKVIYEKIISSFRFRHRNGDFRAFLRQIASSAYFYESNSHEYLGRAVEKIRNGTDGEYTWEWIEGKPSWYYYPPMYEYSTCANIYCYLLSGVGWAVKNILGMNGFLILLDEAESVDHYWYSSYQNNKAWNFLRGLILMANNDELLLKEVREGKFYEHPIYKGWWGDYTDLQYCGYKQLSFIWKIPCNVKIVFAFAPSWVLNKEPLNSLENFELENLDERSLIEISSNIIKLYQRAYDFQANVNSNYFNDLIPKDKTRMFIKSIIDLLDLMRFHSDKSIEELLK